MKQILHNLEHIETALECIPCPSVRPGQLLTRISTTIVSNGTEKMLVDFGKPNLIDKAKLQPDKVRANNGVKP